MSARANSDCPGPDQPGARCDVDTPQGGFVFTVTTTDDTSTGVCDIVEPCSLRDAIEAANSHPNVGVPDEIHFAIPGSGVQTITPSTGLPHVTDPVIINGLTQPGASCASWPPTLLIEVNGSAVSQTSGLTLVGDSTLMGLVINRFDQDGVELRFAGNNTLYCNFIGTDASGLEGLGNSGSGVLVRSDNNVIGGETPDRRNLPAGHPCRLKDAAQRTDRPRHPAVPLPAVTALAPGAMNSR